MASITMRMPAVVSGTRSTPWVLLVLGFAILYVPGLVTAFRSAATADDVVNAMFVIGISGWFLQFRVGQLLRAGQIDGSPAGVFGGLVLLAGLVVYALGRSQQLPTLEFGSLIPVLAGIVAIFFGFRTLGRLWVVLFLLLFIVPLPPSVAADITQPVKIAVSAATEFLLRHLDYPIARDGAVLVIGQYQLLVADACSGLRSLFTLEALGLMYVTFLGHASALRKTVLAILIVPISFTANTLRVVTLTLITFYFGDAAGQGFLHNFAGMTLFISALLLIVGIDTAMTRTMHWYRKGGDSWQQSP
jgi:exosortase B